LPIRKSCSQQAETDGDQFTRGEADTQPQQSYAGFRVPPYAFDAGSNFNQIQAALDSLHTLRKTVVSRVLVDHVALQVGVIAPKTRNSRFQAGESLLDLARP